MSSHHVLVLARGTFLPSHVGGYVGVGVGPLGGRRPHFQMAPSYFLPEQALRYLSPFVSQRNIGPLSSVCDVELLSSAHFT